MQKQKNRFGVKSYNILAYSLQGKQKIPMVNLICSKNNKEFLIKTSLEKNNSLAKKAIKIEYEMSSKYYKKLLDPKLSNGYSLITRYISKPTLSYYLNSFFRKKKDIPKVIGWLVDFHNENHKNGMGQIHGDFSAHEIIVLDDEVVVFDWEDYELKNEQLIDIFYFIFRSEYQNAIIGSREKNILKFINSIIGQKKHPFLQMYLDKRKNVSYSSDRINKAFRSFLDQRIRRENKYYTVPRKDRYLYRQMKKIINAN